MSQENKVKKALILDAGKPNVERGRFPRDSKPKCLYKYHNEVILERQVKRLRKFGIEEIYVVVNYKAEMMKEFSKERNLNLNFIKSPTCKAKRLALPSLKVGLEVFDPEDTIIFMLGDYLLSDEFLKNLLNCKAKFCLVKAKAEAGVAKFKVKDLGKWQHLKKELLSYGKDSRILSEQERIAEDIL